MPLAPQDAISSPAWTLRKGIAQTFYARSSGMLRVQSGRIWVTITRSANSPQPRWRTDLVPGDMFVQAGDVLTLRAGQTVVIESWPAQAGQATALQWETTLRTDAARWQTSVADPLREAGSAALVMARALMRVLAGLAGYAEYIIAGRGKVQPALEANAP